MRAFIIFGILQALWLVSAQAQAQTQERSSIPADPFEMRVPSIQLTDQSIVDGVASLSRSTNIAYSVEFPLGPTISTAAPPLKLITAAIPQASVRQMLDELCNLDPTFTWMRRGNDANILPRDLANDPRYLLNRSLESVRLSEVQSAQQAVVSMVDQLSGPREQIAILQSGVALNFAQPWTERLHNITVREFLDEVARHLGPTYGWQFGGATDFRVITFHQRLAPKPRRDEQKSGQQ
jgi:hypothetical protein